jgi:hypothetical protein
MRIEATIPEETIQMTTLNTLLDSFRNAAVTEREKGTILKS